MSIYLNRLLPRSNSSILLRSGNAIQSEVLRLRDETFLLDAGIGSPKICMKHELISPKINNTSTRFENKVGYQGIAAGDSTQINGHLLQRFFVDLIAGDSLAKENAASRFSNLVGPTDLDAVPGEPLLVLPKRFRQAQVWMKLNKIWRTNSSVKGFYIDKLRSGYSVAIAGYVAFLPRRQLMSQRLSQDRFIIESIDPKRNNIVLH